jgi:6-phosphogluconolactonase
MERELRVVDDVAEAGLDLFLAARPRTIVLSGGSTPKALYERLADIEYPWREVECFFGDERCVPRTHEHSNLRMATEAFLMKVRARVYAIDGSMCDAADYERVLRRRFDDEPRFDLAWYGLGPDGHTASLFPGRSEVEATERWAVRVPEAGQPPWVPRVTMTVPVLSGASMGVFLVEGRDKREALAKLMEGEDIPAARVAPDRLVVLADRDAAAE